MGKYSNQVEEGAEREMPTSALTFRLEEIKKKLFRVEDRTEEYQRTLGEYTLGLDEETPAGAMLNEPPSRQTVSQLLYTIERALARIGGIQDNLDNVIL